MICPKTIPYVHTRSVKDDEILEQGIGEIFPIFHMTLFFIENLYILSIDKGSGMKVCI